MNFCEIKNNVLEKVFYIPVFVSKETIIPSDVKEIGQNAFAGISSFSEIIIPPSVEIIRSGAFHDCKGLKKIIIPETVKLVEDGAFANCVNLEEVQYSILTQFEELCFSNCPSLKRLSDGTITARTFYLSVHNQFAVTIKQDALSTREYNVYLGRFADVFFPDTEPNYESPLVYFVEIINKDNTYVWYDTDLQTAIIGAQYQASRKGSADFFKKEWSVDSEITPNEFSLLTGICYEGINLWIDLKHGDRNTKWPLKEVLQWLHGLAPKVYDRLVYALEHQHEPAPLKFFTEGVLKKEVFEQQN